jgi:hypothetical protein
MSLDFVDVFYAVVINKVFGSSVHISFRARSAGDRFECVVDTSMNIY